MFRNTSAALAAAFTAAFGFEADAMLGRYMRSTWGFARGGFRLRRRSKYKPHQGERERARRARQLFKRQLDFTASGQDVPYSRRRVLWPSPEAGK